MAALALQSSISSFLARRVLSLPKENAQTSDYNQEETGDDQPMRELKLHRLVEHPKAFSVSARRRLGQPDPGVARAFRNSSGPFPPSGHRNRLEPVARSRRPFLLALAGPVTWVRLARRLCCPLDLFGGKNLAAQQCPPDPSARRDSLGLAVSATNAKVVACKRKSLLRPEIFKTEACADFGAISPPVDLLSFCDARSFSSEQVQLSSRCMDDQAMFVGH